MASVVGASFEEVEPSLESAAREADPIFARIGSSWAVVSPGDTWDYCRSQITALDLEALERVVQDVLGAVDPVLDLPRDERWKAAIHGRQRIHSAELRRGIASTLVLLGARGDDLQIGGGATGRMWAERVVWALLRRANEDETGHLWQSLSDVLPALAEAAPDLFLRGVQEGLAGQSVPIAKMFEDADANDAFSYGSAHTGLLWALEVIAWSRTHFGLAVDTLAQLAEVDPGGRLSNRPANSLAEVFQPWLPQTSASVEARLSALDRLSQKHQDVGRTLLLALLPQSHSVGRYTTKPSVRDWAEVQPSVSTREFWEFSVAVAEKLMAQLAAAPQHWVEFVDRLPDLPPDARELAYQRLAAVEAGILTSTQRRHVWEAVENLVRRHREYADAGWAMTEDEIGRIESAADHLHPSSPRDQHRWLFDHHLPDIGMSKADDLAAYELKVAELRAEAASEIFEDEGLSGLVTLADEVEVPWELGAGLARSSAQHASEDVLDLLDSDSRKIVAFATGYARIISDGRLEWVARQLQPFEGRHTVQARMLATASDLPAVWELLPTLSPEVDSAYWSEFHINGRGSDFAHTNEAARQLLNHGRSAMALDLLNLYARRGSDLVDPQLVVEGLNAFLSQVDPEAWVLSSWDISNLMEYLRSSEVSEDTIATLEWRLLPILGFEPDNLALEKKLASDADFFVEVLSLTFKPKSGEMEQEVSPEVAQNAFTLLHNWRTIPGSAGRGAPVDADRLLEWVKRARERLAEVNRSDIGEQYIGQVLAHAAEDEDGSWPTKPVRQLIEASASVQLDRGFEIGTYNKRGVTTRGALDGGALEYDLAARFDAWANSVTDNAPRTAAMLRSLAEGYRAEGRRNDEEVQRLREGFDR